MKVEILTRLKNGPKIIDAGTTFEGKVEDLPDFVRYELRRNRGTIRILSESPKIEETSKVGKPTFKASAAKKAPAAKKSAAKKSTAKSKSDKASLRSKLNDM